MEEETAGGWKRKQWEDKRGNIGQMEEETRLDGEGNSGKMEEETAGGCKRKQWDDGRGNAVGWRRKQWEDGRGNSGWM